MQDVCLSLEVDKDNYDGQKDISVSHMHESINGTAKTGVEVLTKTGSKTYLSSWTSTDDRHSPGDYACHCDPTGYPQLITRKHPVLLVWLGLWNGFGFIGMPYSRPIFSFGYIYKVGIDEVKVC